MPSSPHAYPLHELAEHCHAKVVGDGTVLINRVATLQSATGGAITFLANPKYRSLLFATKASAVVLSPAEMDATSLPRLVSENPYAAYAKIALLLNPPAPAVPGRHPAAVIAAEARVAATASIGAGVVIGARASVGEGSVIHPGAIIGEEVDIGADCRIYANTVIYPRCVLKDRIIVHAGAVIGADGFGMAEEQGNWIKIPQLGRVVIHNDVEIGANTTIDRGAMDDTIIEEGVKLDNQIQIGHNCRIGAHTVIAGCVGIAGSTIIGKHCKIGGAAMIVGHVNITDRVIISGGTLVSKSIREPGVYTAVFPFNKHEHWVRSAPYIRHLDKLDERLRRLERAQRASTQEDS